MGILAHLFLHQGRLRSGWRVGLYLAAYLGLLMIVQTPAAGLYVALLTSQGIDTLSALLDAVQPDRMPVWLFLLLKVAELGALLPLTFLFCRLLDRRAWVSLGFRRNPGWLLEMALGLAVGGGQMLLIFGVEWAAGWLSVSLPERSELGRMLVASVTATVLFVLVALSEELLFRGYVQSNLAEGMGRWPALALTSLVFGVFHALNPNLNWLALANIALAGAVMGYCRMITGNLWLPMAYHFAWNSFQGIAFSLPVSGVRYGGLLSVVDQGTAPLLTGTAFGPEGGLTGTFALLSSLPILWLWNRSRHREAERQSA